MCESVFWNQPQWYTPPLEKTLAYSYTWFHRKLTYSCTVLWIYIPLHIYCNSVWGEGEGTQGKFGMGMGVSILKSTPIIYPAFEKEQPIHILIFTESWPIHILFFEFIHPFISFVICKQVYKWPSSRENLLYVNVKTKAWRLSEWKICA